jgi:hypothetical protein
MRWWGVWATILTGFSLSAVPAAGVCSVTTAGITVPVVTTPPAVDGTLSADAWKDAAKVSLPYNIHTHATSEEPTTVYLLADSTSLYVAFDAQQPRTPVLANQHTNNVGIDTDDEVLVDLWPNGSQGFSYQFLATPIGTRYQTSTENLSYEPQWDAVGHVDSSHYVVTMRIPLSVMRGASKDRWLVQLARYEPATNAVYVYNGNSTTNGNNDVQSARPLAGIPTVAAQRPQARFAPYALGAIAGSSIGGSTSRTGLDLAVPVTSSTSLVATLHPDFSNVENDQQSIAPTAFRRYFNETRPFFAQGSSFYNYYECDACPNAATLYTPGIPTPSYGYAIEGKQGPLSFAGFNSVVTNERSDSAEVLNYRTIPRNLFYTVQRVAVDMPGFKDDTMQYSTKWSDLKNKFVYANYAQENGTNVSDPGKARWMQAGGGWYGPQVFTGFSITKLGSQYSPYDGFVSYNDIAGYGIFSQHDWQPRAGAFKNLHAYAFVDRYDGATGPNYSDSQVGFDLKTRKLWEFAGQVGSSFGLNSSNINVPLNQQTWSITYHAGTPTPTMFGYATGAYGFGKLDSSYRSTTIKAGHGMYLTLEADDTRQYMPSGTVNVQWLERASLAFQTGRDSSFAIGWRKFVGTPPDPSGGGNCLAMCTNFSFAYHKRFDHRELYAAYGNPSQLSTVPQFLVKIIDYIGADKGT